MAKKENPKSKQSKGADGGAQPALRRAMVELDELFGETLVVECSEVSPLPDLDESVEFDDSHPLAPFAEKAIDLVVDVIHQWYDSPMKAFEYGCSIWNMSEDGFSGQVVLFEIDLGESGFYAAVVAPPGPTPDEATTMVWIARETDDAE